MFKKIGKYNKFDIYDEGDGTVSCGEVYFTKDIDILHCEDWKMPFGKYKGETMMWIKDYHYFKWLSTLENLDYIFKDRVRFCLHFGYPGGNYVDMTLLGRGSGGRRSGYSGWNTYYGDEILDASDLC